MMMKTYRGHKAKMEKSQNLYEWARGYIECQGCSQDFEMAGGGGGGGESKDPVHITSVKSLMAGVLGLL